MKRIQLVYGDRAYTVADPDYDDLCSEIRRSVESGRPSWLEVNIGEGRPTSTRLLISSATTIAVIRDEIDPGADEADASTLDFDERRP